MTTRGGHPPLLVAAWRVLLDALDALDAHTAALVLVGAQAVYLRSEDAGPELAVAAYTSDGDLAVRLGSLAERPHLEDALSKADFSLRRIAPGQVEPGVGVRTTTVGSFTFEVPVDLLVPSSQLTGSRRSAAPPPHERTAARRIDELDAALVDHSPLDLPALEDVDSRISAVNVAGPTALLVSKLHKIEDRLKLLESTGKDRLKEGKDAADIYRLMRTQDRKPSRDGCPSWDRTQPPAPASSPPPTCSVAVLGPGSGRVGARHPRPAPGAVGNGGPRLVRRLDAGRHGCTLTGGRSSPGEPDGRRRRPRAGGPAGSAVRFRCCLACWSPRTSL